MFTDEELNILMSASAYMTKDDFFRYVTEMYEEKKADIAWERDMLTLTRDDISDLKQAETELDEWYAPFKTAHDKKPFIAA